MKIFSAPSRRAVVFLGVSLLGIAGWVRASVQPNSPKNGDDDGEATLGATLSAPTGNTTSSGTTGAYNFYGGTTSATASMGGDITVSGGTLTLNSSNYGGTRLVKETIAASLTGSAGDLKITESPDGGTLRVKTNVAITNAGKKAAKNILATVYLSDDAVLDTAKDTKLATLKLGDYVPDFTKLPKGQTLTIPIKHKVPTAAAEFLEGRYLIVVLTGDTTAMVESGVSGLTFINPGTIGVLNPGTTAALPLTGSTALATNPDAVDLTGTFFIGQGGSILSLQNLTATVTNTFQLGGGNGGFAGTLTSGGTTTNLIAGLTQTAQVGDVLSVVPGYTLTSVSTGWWTLPSGGALTLTASLTVTSPVATASPTPTPTPIPTLTPSPTATPTPTVPANEVVIGPIHLP